MKKLIPLIFFLLISLASAELQIFGNPSTNPIIELVPTVTTTGGGSNSSSNFTQADADTLYWRLDATNRPTANWNMSLYNLTDVGSIFMADNSTFQAGQFLSSLSFLTSSLRPGVKTYSIGSNTSRPEIIFPTGFSPDLPHIIWIPYNGLTYFADSMSGSETSDGALLNYNGTDFLINILNTTSKVGRLVGNWSIAGGINATGRICDSVGCISNTVSANYTNLFFLNNTNQNITGQNLFKNTTTFVTNTGKVRIGDNAGTADILNIYADSGTGYVTFDDSEMGIAGSLLFEPVVEIQNRLRVYPVTDIYSQIGTGTLSAVAASDSADKLVVLKEPSSITGAHRAITASCEVNANQQTSSGACMGLNAYAMVQSGVNYNSTVTTFGGGLRASRNNIILAGSGNVSKATGFTGVGTVSGSGSTITNMLVYNSEAPSISVGGTITNYTAFNVESATVSGTLTNHIGLRIQALSSSATGKYGILQEGTADENYLSGFTKIRILNVTTTLRLENATAWNNFAVCYTTGGQLGHCTNAVNSTGGCTCASN